VCGVCVCVCGVCVCVCVVCVCGVCGMCLVILAFELRASYLLGRHSTT
jgi:hypothetical protein